MLLVPLHVHVYQLYYYSVLQDRFAEARATPPIDESQDWSLVGAEEDDGYTVLEFTRNYYSCDDDYDLNIEASELQVLCHGTAHI